MVRNSSLDKSSWGLFELCGNSLHIFPDVFGEGKIGEVEKALVEAFHRGEDLTVCLQARDDLAGVTEEILEDLHVLCLEAMPGFELIPVAIQGSLYLRESIRCYQDPASLR